MKRQNFIPATVLAACVLHNVCLDFNDEFVEEYINDGLPAVLGNGDAPGAGNCTNENTESAQLFRDELCRQVTRSP